MKAHLAVALVALALINVCTASDYQYRYEEEAEDADPEVASAGLRVCNPCPPGYAPKCVPVCTPCPDPCSPPKCPPRCPPPCRPRCSRPYEPCEPSICWDQGRIVFFFSWLRRALRSPSFRRRRVRVKKILLGLIYYAYSLQRRGDCDPCVPVCPVFPSLRSVKVGSLVDALRLIACQLDPKSADCLMNQAYRELCPFVSGIPVF